MIATSRSKHRARARRRGWAPRALLGVATVPVGIVAGLAVSLGSVALDRPGLAWLGVLVAGVPAVHQAVRAAVLDAELRSVRQPTGAFAREPAVTTEVQTAAPDVDRAPGPATSPRGLTEGRIDTGELQRIWDLGEAPDTGPQRVVSMAAQRVLLGASGRLGTGVAEDRVYDALVVAEADELTRALELPTRRGRHAASAPLDAVQLAPAPVVSGRRGRHAA